MNELHSTLNVLSSCCTFNIRSFSLLDILRSPGLGGCTKLTQDNEAWSAIGNRGAMWAKCSTIRGTSKDRNEIVGQNVPCGKGTIDAA